MLYVNYSEPEPGPVNPQELAEVRQLHMPPFAVRFASCCELQRVAQEVTCQHPHLREETHFVVQEELGRRQLLATTMQAVAGGPSHA